MKLANQLLVVVLLFATGCAYNGYNYPTAYDPQTGLPSYSAPQAVTPNGYGLGVNQDIYGRPHQYRTQDGQVEPGIFNGGVKRDAYGPGVHMDQFGRPVYDSTP